MAVLIEEKVDSNTCAQRGFSRNYLPVRVLGEAASVNRELSVRLDHYVNGALIGRALSAGPATETGFAARQ